MAAQGTESHSSSDMVASGTFWGLLGTFFVKIISFLYTVYVARMVSQGEVGLFYLALGIVGLFGVWKDLGLPGALTRYVPYFDGRGEYRKIRQLFLSSVALNAISGIALTALIWLIADWIGMVYGNPALPEALRLMSYFMLLDNLVKIGGAFLQGRMAIKEGQLLGNFQVLSKLALTVLLFTLWGPSVATLTIAFLASNLLSVLFSLPFLRAATAGLPHGGEGLSAQEVYRGIIPFGIMLTILQTFYTIISSTDRVLLGYLAPPSSANELIAIYTMATSLAINVNVFPGAVGNIFLPVISRLTGKNDMAGIRKTVATAQRWVLFITIPMVAVMAAFAGEMLSSFYGAPYRAGAAAMVLFMAGLVCSAFTYTIGLALAGMRLVKLELKIALVAGVANVILNLLLVPQWGLEGAGFAAGASFALTAVLFAHYGHSVLSFRSPPGAYKMIAAGIATCLLVFALKPSVEAAGGMLPSFGDSAIAPYLGKLAYLALLGAMSVLSFAVFSAMCIALRCFGSEDAEVMRKVARRAYVPVFAIDLAEGLLYYGIPEGKDGRKH